MEYGKELSVGNVLVGRAVHSGYSERKEGCKNSYTCEHRDSVGELGIIRWEMELRTSIAVPPGARSGLSEIGRS